MTAEVKDSSGKKETGRWSAQEHQRFMLGIFQYGKDWKKVQQIVGTRSGSQVRSHAQKFFNRLQKQQHGPRSRQHNQGQGQASETQNDFLKGIIQQQASLHTPLQIVSLIKKQSGHDKTVNVNKLIQKLQSEGKQVQEKKKQVNSHQPQKDSVLGGLQKQHNSFKSMTNILSAYENINQDKNPIENQDQSFLLLLTKKYKKFFAKGGQFENLIDFKDPNQILKAQKSHRKRSFTLLQGQQSDEDKLQQVKKKIKANQNNQNPSQKVTPLKEFPENFKKQQQVKQKSEQAVK